MEFSLEFKVCVIATCLPFTVPTPRAPVWYIIMERRFFGVATVGAWTRIESNS